MKRVFIAAAIAALLFVAGCASPPTASVPAASDPREAVATAVATCATAVERIATAQTGDAASRVVAIGALERMCGGQAGTHLAIAAQPAPAPPGLGQTLLSAALQVGDLFVRGYGLKLTRDIGIVQSNNQASTAIASYGAFTQLGTAGITGATDGYRYVQAPGAVTTTTNTLSGTGVLGSGTYTGPVSTTTTTTRTCSSGAAGAGGGTTTGAAGGASGGANC